MPKGPISIDLERRTRRSTKKTKLRVREGTMINFTGGVPSSLLANIKERYKGASEASEAPKSWLHRLRHLFSVFWTE
jgi:hypothetical protein